MMSTLLDLDEVELYCWEGQESCLDALVERSKLEFLVRGEIGQELSMSSSRGRKAFSDAAFAQVQSKAWVGLGA